jgi:Ca-activated chloride channel family protein
MVTTIQADDNLIAQRLFDKGRFAEAAEIYTDPAWKGIALYNSSQWWRAAEAFIRADDHQSMHNLGNTYVKMGYYALALEAYQMALARQPEFTDAQFNADLMRQLLAEEQDQKGESALQRRGEEIDRVESEGDEQPGGSSDEGDDPPDKENDSGEDREGDTDDRGPTPQASAAGDSGEAGSEKTLEDDGKPEGGSTQGTESESNSERNPSTGAEGRESVSDAQAASMRAALETTQANEQWLNQINHDAEKFLRRKIELELARRKAAGESAPEGGNLW